MEGWQVPPVLIERASAPGHGLRFSLSVSFYHAGSKRFYGDTYMGELLDEEDGERVEVVSERSRGKSSTPTKSSGGQKVGYVVVAFINQGSSASICTAADRGIFIYVQCLRWLICIRGPCFVFSR